MSDTSPSFPAAAEPAEALPDYAFTPVPTRLNRHDGWTPERQRRFVAALAAMGSVARAARAVGMGITSSYNLRRRAGAESFAAAWDTALEEGRCRAFDRAMDRAVNGFLVPRFYRGQIIGYLHRHDDAMTIAALRYALPAGWNAETDDAGLLMPEK